MEERIAHIEANQIVILALQFAMLIPWFIAVLGDETMRRVLPKIFVNGKRAFEMTLKQVKPRKAKPVDKDYLPLPPVFDETIFRQLCRDLLKDIDDAQKRGGSMGDVKVTEDEWVTKKRFRGTREQFTECRAMLEKKGVLRIVDGRGTRGWWVSPRDGSYAGARERLARLAKG